MLRFLVRRRRLQQMFESGEEPRPLRWRPRFRIFGIGFGLIFGESVALLVQQLGYRRFETPDMVLGAVAGLVVGVALPSAVWAYQVWRYNRLLRSARPELASANQIGRAGLTVLAVVAGAGASVLAAAPAHAEIEGPCSGVFEGHDVSRLDSGDPGDAVTIDSDAAVSYSVGSETERVVHRRFELHWANLTSVLDEGVIDPVDDASKLSDDGRTYSGTSNVVQFAWMGSGLYRVDGFAELADGTTCTGSLLVDIDRNPFDTIYGVAAIAGTTVGTVGLGLVSLGMVWEGISYRRALRRFLSQGQSSPPAPPPTPPPASPAHEASG